MGNYRAEGIEGEEMACRYLTARGYRLLERNYSASCGEIDLILTDGKCIIFVEVKRRTTQKYGSPAEAVTPSKQRKICMTAAIYLKQHHAVDLPFRFDVIEIFDREIHHLLSAFGSEILM